MKKIIILTFAAIGMISAMVQAQSLSVSSYLGASFDQKGLLNSSEPVLGITTLAGIGNDIVSLGLDMSGGQRYRYKSDTVWKSTNAPAIQFLAALNLPPGGEERINHFAGPIFGLAFGPGFSGINRAPVGNFKMFLQCNYGGPVGKMILGGFTQFSFSCLGSATVMYSWAAVIGLRVTIPNAFSSGEE